jgi:23S rRNA (uracil1939-C5)-methyltransferase
MALALEATEPGSPRLEGKGGLLATLCPHFGPCGGCDALDRPYARQLATKHAALLSLLADVPGLDPTLVSPVHPDPHPFHYRNKAALPFARSARGRVVAGFYRRGTHEIVDLRRCDVQDPALTAVAGRVREEAARRRLAVGDEKGPALRHLFLRLGRRTGELQVAFVTRGGLFPECASLVEAARDAASRARDARGRPVRLVSALRSIHSSRGNRILGSRSVPLSGRPWIFDRMGPWRVRVSLPSFYQVNPSMAIRAIRIANRLAREGRLGRIVDAYSGIGALALSFGDRAREIVGIERVAEAVADARWNARANGCRRARFVEADVEEALGEEVRGADLVLLDPPRAGCSEKVRAILLESPPPAVLYLSCNPRTLARDLAALGEVFAVGAVRPLDFFPQTDHLEVLVLLRRRGAS